MGPEAEKTGEEDAHLKAPETDGGQTELQTTKETIFNTNDLITSDTYIGRITELLKSNNIRFKVKEITKALPVHDEQGKELYTIPGEFVISIYDAEEDKPANAEYTKEIFDLIRSQDWPIRFGNRGDIS